MRMDVLMDKNIDRQTWRLKHLFRLKQLKLWNTFSRIFQIEKTLISDYGLKISNFWVIFPRNYPCVLLSLNVFDRSLRCWCCLECKHFAEALIAFCLSFTDVNFPLCLHCTVIPQKWTVYTLFYKFKIPSSTFTFLDGYLIQNVFLVLLGTDTGNVMNHWSEF